MVRAHNASAKLCNSIVLAKFFAKKIALLLDFPLFFNLFSRVEADIGRLGIFGRCPYERLVRPIIVLIKARCQS